jgi:dTMP kinase
MHKKKPLFITFEGIEGSGKSYQSQKLFKKLKTHGYNTVYTREPGGSLGAEQIRKVILTGSKNKFLPVTDTLLYLAARNEHINKLIIPSLKKKKIIICDRFIDSTLSYQVYGKRVSKKLVNIIHKEILKNIKPDLTFILKLNISKALKRINKRGYKNRYDMLGRNFYNTVQKSFVKIGRENKNRCIVLDSTKDTKDIENFIFKKVIEYIKK